MSDTLTSISPETKKKRLVWLDIAKAIAIFAMIEGHTAPYGGPLRNFIYSFHMPLFFIATGFTSHPSQNWPDFFKSLKKDFLRIMLPAIGIQALNGLISFLMYHENALSSIHLRVEQMLWASSFDIYGHSCVGMIWFLVAMFWTKTLFNLIFLIFPTKYNGTIFLALGFLGKILSDKQIYFPQSLDVCLVAVMFVYMGYVFKKIYPLFEKYQAPITAVCFFFWIYCYESGITIDVGGRLYPHFIAGVLSSICACLAIFTFSQALESCRPVSFVLSAMGRHTLTILCVSFLDWIAIAYWSNKGYTYAYIARPAIVLAVTFVVVMAWCGIKKLLRSIQKS